MRHLRITYEACIIEVRDEKVHYLIRAMPKGSLIGMAVGSVEDAEERED